MGVSDHPVPGGPWYGVWAATVACLADVVGSAADDDGWKDTLVFVGDAAGVLIGEDAGLVTPGTCGDTSCTISATSTPVITVPLADRIAPRRVRSHRNPRADFSFGGAVAVPFVRGGCVGLLILNRPVPSIETSEKQSTTTTHPPGRHTST
jgi:hypothetical protein